MTAPVFTQYVRKMDTAFGSRLLKKNAGKVWPYMTRARMQAQVYAFDDQASYEMGAASALPPSELRRMLMTARLPHELTWIEFNWRKSVEGMSAGGVACPEQTEENPDRQGFLFFPLNKDAAGFDGATGWSCVNCYTYDVNGKTELQLGTWVMAASHDEPHFEVLWRDNQRRLKELTRGTTTLHEGMHTGLGHAYCDMDWRDSPKEREHAEWLYPRTTLQPAFPTDREGHWTIMREVNGATRMAITLLAMATSAQPPKAKETITAHDTETMVMRKTGKAKPYPVTEVNLYLDPEREPKTRAYYAKRAMSAAERARKRLHDVEAHWCYRKPTGASQGRSARECPELPEHGHNWMRHVFREGWQQCTECGQERWPRKGHQRGDEELGAVPRKLRNVKA